MGYDIHITRKQNWWDDGTEIPLEEWLAVVREDPEMRLDGHAEAQTQDGQSTIRVEDPSLSVWTAYSGHGRDGNMAWHYWADGNVIVKNPDEEILRKMAVLAKRLGARVQGDEGEFYGDDGEQIPEAPEPTPTVRRTPAPAPRKPWWRFW